MGCWAKHETTKTKGAHLRETTDFRLASLIRLKGLAGRLCIDVNESWRNFITKTTQRYSMHTMFIEKNIEVFLKDMLEDHSKGMLLTKEENKIY